MPGRMYGLRACVGEVVCGICALHFVVGRVVFQFHQVVLFFNVLIVRVCFPLTVSTF